MRQRKSIVGKVVGFVLLLSIIAGMIGREAWACCTNVTGQCTPCSKAYQILYGKCGIPGLAPGSVVAANSQDEVEWGHEGPTQHNGKWWFKITASAGGGVISPITVCFHSDTQNGTYVAEKPVNATISYGSKKINGVDQTGWWLSNADTGINVKLASFEITWADGTQRIISSDGLTIDDGPTHYARTKDAQGRVTSLSEYISGTTAPIRQTYWHYTDDGTPVTIRKRVTTKTFSSEATPTAQYATEIQGFYGGSAGTGIAGQLYYVVSAEGVKRYLTATTGGSTNLSHGVDPSDPGNTAGNLCDLDDRAIVSDADLINYADVVYNGYDSEGRVTSQTANSAAGCASCGSGSGNLTGTYTFSYGTNATLPANDDEKVNLWQTYRRTTDPSGLQTVEYFNSLNQVIFKITQATVGNNRYLWTDHYKYDMSGRVTEHRTPSACKNYDWDNDANGNWPTLKDSTVKDSDTIGLVELSVYDDNGNLTATKVRNGTSVSATTYWRHKYVYDDVPNSIYGSTTFNGSTVYRVTSDILFPSDTTTDSAPDARTTTYAYAYYCTDNSVTTSNNPAGKTVTHAVAFVKTTYPTVSTNNNGSGNPTTSIVHYRQVPANGGSVPNTIYYQDWIKNQDGTLEYQQQNRSNNQTIFNLQDVATADSNGTVTGKTEDDGTTLHTPLDPWVNSNWVTPSAVAGAGKNRLTQYAYDGYGRSDTVTTPDGLKSKTVYMSQKQTSGNKETTISFVTLTARHIDGTTHEYNYLPLQINVADMVGRTIVSAAGLPTSHTDGDLTNDWIVATTNVQDAFVGSLTSRLESIYDSTGRLVQTIRYSNPSNVTQYRSITSYYYDSATGQLAKVTSPDNTIRKTSFDALGRPVATQIGTNDGTGSSNMVTVSQTFYDGDTSGALVAGGSGNVTETRAIFGTGGTDYYATKRQYDWLNRMTDSKGPNNLVTHYSLVVYDSTAGQDKSTVQTYVDSNNNFALDNGELRGQVDSYIDELGRTWKTTAYDVRAADGSLHHSMTSTAWYDSMGRTIKTRNANGLYRKTQYDSVGQTLASFVCYAASNDSGNDPTSVSNDIVIEQVNSTYDDATGRLKWTTSYQRNPGYTTTAGDLSSSWDATHARRTYQAFWYDSPLGRPSDQADYGTNAFDNTTWTAGAPSPGGTIPVVHLDYDERGRQNKTTNAKGIVTVTSFDNLNRVTKVVENFTGSGTVTETDVDTNRTTVITYDTEFKTQLIAYKPRGSGLGIEYQITKYAYGTYRCMSGTPLVYRNDLLRAVIYPDSSDNPAYFNYGNNHVEYTYDRLSRRKTVKDQNGTEHTYIYDSAGRFEQDQATALGANIDNTILRIQRTYDEVGRVNSVASYDATSNGNKKNEVKFTYADDSWGQLTKIEQNNTTSVGTGTPAIDYAYDDGASGTTAKFLRLVSVTYPGPSTRRVIYGNYPSTGTDGDMLSRVDNLGDGNTGTYTKYAQFSYLGAGTIYKVDHPQVSGTLTLNYDNGTAGAYAGLDPFGQVADQKWTVNGTTVDDYGYGYDLAGNRIYRKNTQSTTRSEFYTYDNLDRLSNAKKGTLASDNSGISTPASEEAFTLDQLGNWAGYVAKTNGSITLDQSRTHTPANATATLTTNSGTSWVTPPTYDTSGNMTAGPKPGTETAQLKFVYDAWNRVVTVKDGSDATVATYAYNGLNQRIQKVDKTVSPNVTTDYYYNEAWQVLEEQKTVGTGSAATYAQYVWDPRYIDTPVCRFRDSNADGTLDETLYYTTDANMNVTALVKTNGHVVERYVYDSYGKVAIHQGTHDLTDTTTTDWDDRSGGSIALNEILFAGYRLDPESGLYQVRFRYYHPTLGKWISRDPAGYVDGMGLYEYCATNSVALTDPTGLKTDAILWSTWYTTWKETHGFASAVPGLDDQMKDTLSRGCVGVTCLNLGVSRKEGFVWPDTSNCFHTFPQAKARQKTMSDTGDCCKTKNMYGTAGGPRIYSIHFWYNKDFTPATTTPDRDTGQVSMKNWDHDYPGGKPGPHPAGHFDYGWYDSSEDKWIHATGSNGDWSVLISDYDDWNAGYGPGKYDGQVFCVACEDWTFGKSWPAANDAKRYAPTSTTRPATTAPTSAPAATTVPTDSSPRGTLYGRSRP